MTQKILALLLVILSSVLRLNANDLDQCVALTSIGIDSSSWRFGDLIIVFDKDDYSVYVDDCKPIEIMHGKYARNKRMVNLVPVIEVNEIPHLKEYFCQYNDNSIMLNIFTMPITLELIFETRWWNRNTCTEHRVLISNEYRAIQLYESDYTSITTNKFLGNNVLAFSYKTFVWEDISLLLIDKSGKKISSNLDEFCLIDKTSDFIPLFIIDNRNSINSSKPYCAVFQINTLDYTLKWPILEYYYIPIDRREILQYMGIDE